MTIMLAVHPFVGRSLPVVRWLRVRGEPYVELLHPRGWTIRVPQEWTERGRPTVVPELEGRPVRLDLRGLVRLATCVRQKLDKAASNVTVAVEQAPDGNFEQSGRRPNASRKDLGLNPSG